MKIGTFPEKESKLFYTLEDLCRLLQLPAPSARVWASRKVKSGDLMRIRRNLYVLPHAYAGFDEVQLFQLANVIQTPSYISYATALSYYGLTTQIMPSLIESTNPIRSQSYHAGAVEFRYHYCSPPLYFGFSRKNGVFIAEPEKALLDSCYLMAMGRYALDEPALNLKELNRATINKWLKKYPLRFQKYFHRWRAAYENTETA